MIWQRLKNLWKLSQVSVNSSGEIISPENIPQIIIISPEAQFIPYPKRDPAKEIIKDT